MDRVRETLNFLFGCHHHNLSRVFTIAGRTNRVCCDCGTEFKYSLTTMSVERPIARDSMLTSLRIT